MTATRYGSDAVVDALRSVGVPYVTLNPGASFRGLHDSLVNYQGEPDQGPVPLEVPHEKIAVGIAHGYAKAGPVLEPGLVGDAVRAAVKVVTETGRPALVDVVCAPPEPG